MNQALNDVNTSFSFATMLPTIVFDGLLVACVACLHGLETCQGAERLATQGRVGDVGTGPNSSEEQKSEQNREASG